MLNGKQRAYLRSLANGLDSILIVGKGGIDANILKQADDPLAARELIKGSVLETSPVTPREAADRIARASSACLRILASIPGERVRTRCR